MNINYSIPVSLFDYRESENSLYSFAKLKIFYIGETQDRRVFTKEFSEQLIKSLPYVPVVGYYDEEAEDFIGHNASIQNIYGIVPEDTTIEYIWENGLQYAVCDVILYTGRLDRTGEIAQKIVGKQHSLELNPDDTKYEIRKDGNGKIQNIEFVSGSLLGLSILGDGETPAFRGSGFFTESAALFTEDIRNSLNQLYQQEMVQCSFKSQFSRHSYENRRRRAYEALKEMYRDVKFEIKEMTDNFIHYNEYFEDQNGEQYVCNRIYYKDDGQHVELLGGPEEVVVMYLTADEVEMVEGYETSDSLDYQTIGDLDLRPTETMANNAKRGLELRKEHGRGGTAVGVARARDLSNRKNLSPDTVRRMYQYFSRHEVDKKGKGWNSDEEGYPSNGLIAWLLWGGDAGYSWAETRWNQIKRIREGQILDHENVEVKLVDNKLLQEEVVEIKPEALETAENPQIMEEIKEEEMEYPKEEKMEYPKDDKEMIEEEEKEMEGHPDEEEEEMDGHPEEEEKEEMIEEEEEEEKEMEKHPDEEEEMNKDKGYYEEGEEIEEEERMTANETQTEIESEKESSSATLNSSERAELEAFRRERKEGLIVSFEDDLSDEFLSNLSSAINNHSYDELEVILSKEFTRVNRENKKSKPNAFIYKPEVKSNAKSEVDIVKELIQKYK